MTAQRRNNFIEGFNYYVPSMQQGADLGQLEGPYNVNFGAIVLADSDGILQTASNATGAPKLTTMRAATYSRAVMSPFGRNVTAVASAAAANILRIWGRDYLGQPMSEDLTLNGTTPVVGLKAFAYIDVVEPITGTGATTIDVGFGTRMGLPYKTRAVYREYEDQALAAAGTLQAPILTDPQTRVTGDPRGTYVLTGTPNGVKIFEIEVQLDKRLNAAGRGGLHGIQHFNS